MKKIIALIMLTTIYDLVKAQVIYIDDGANVFTSANANVVMHSSDLINNSGQADFSGSIVTMTGSTDNTISGNYPTFIKQLSINKPGNKLVLYSNLQISDKIDFIAGNIDLNGSDIILLTTAILSNENETSRITGDNGGEIFITTTLTNPSNINPGNLGLTFTSNINLGQITVRRGHALQEFQGDVFGIKRYYQVDAASNNFAGTLRLNYFDAELNGQSEPDLQIWGSGDEGVVWINRGYTSKSVAANFIESTDLTQFEKFTLNGPLPGWPYAHKTNKAEAAGTASAASISVQVLPNPTAGNQKTFVKIIAQKAINGTLVIYAADGRAIKNIPVKINPGINTVQLPTESLVPGTYVINLVAQDNAGHSAMFLKQ